MDATVRHFVEAIASWEADLTGARPIVDWATECLVAGLGGEAVATLAGTPSARVDDEVWELLPAALVELGAPWTLGHPERTAIVTTAIEARRYLAGEITARGLCTLVHRRHGHDTHPLIEALSILDDRFDDVELVGGNVESIMHAVDVAARELIAGAGRLLTGSGLDEL